MEVKIMIGVLMQFEQPRFLSGGVEPLGDKGWVACCYDNWMYGWSWCCRGEEYP